MSLIDAQGFRANVGIVVCNKQGEVVWAKRQYPEDAWQFPQGGMQEGETIEQAMYRELEEELGLDQSTVTVLGVTKDWLYYRLPDTLIRHHQKPVCVGQKQHWFLLQLMDNDHVIHLDTQQHQEFIDWKWVPYYYPIDHVVNFKKDVYTQALKELAPYLDKRMQG